MSITKTVQENCMTIYFENDQKESGQGIFFMESRTGIWWPTMAYSPTYFEWVITEDNRILTRNKAREDFTVLGSTYAQQVLSWVAEKALLNK